MPRRDPNKPPQFRGSDFVMRYEQGRWSEDRLIESLKRSGEFIGVPYGRSGIGPKDKEKVKEYWKKYVEVEDDLKRPDILVLPADAHRKNAAKWKDLLKDPTIKSDDELRPILDAAVCGLEAENSLWIAEKMPDFKTTLPVSRVNLVAPRIWVKDEDVAGLVAWQNKLKKPICVVQVFYDRAYIVQLSKVLSIVRRIRRGADRKEQIKLQKTLGVIFAEQSYMDSRSGIAKEKLVYTTHHTVGVLFGTLKERPEPSPEIIWEANGKIMPYVAFKGGVLEVTDECLRFLSSLT